MNRQVKGKAGSTSNTKIILHNADIIGKKATVNNNVIIACRTVLDETHDY